MIWLVVIDGSVAALVVEGIFLSWTRCFTALFVGFDLNMNQ